MNKQFAQLQVYQLGGGIAFGLPTTTTPFLVIPSGQATIKPWGNSGFLFENIVTGDVIAFVNDYDDVLDSSDAAYGVDQPSVFTALAAFFFDLAGGGGDDLAQVLINGNTSGANDIEFDSLQGLLFANNSRLREGTIDAGLGGLKGIAQICAVGYELKWEAGRLYVMDGNGTAIRWSLYNFTTTPTVNDDDTKGYAVGSRWTLDDGAIYVCSDASTGAAVWTIQSNSVPRLNQVLSSSNSADGLNITDLNLLDFDTATTSTVGAGQMAWNDTLGTVDLGLKGGNTISNLGQHIHARVVNKVTPNQTLTKAGYNAVRVSGAQGQRLAIELAQGNNDANSADTIGLVCESIATNQEGFIVCVGQLEGINTTGSLQSETWSDGDVLYLSPTTAGAITNVKPIGAGHIVIIGYVEYSHINQGKIYVKVMNGWELDELHDVSITGAENGNYLEYNGTLWVNKGIVYTVELVAALTVDFYAPYNMKINTISNILNSPTITIQDDGVAYTLTNTIASGSKITVTANTASVVNLNITKA